MKQPHRGLTWVYYCDDGRGRIKIGYSLNPWVIGATGNLAFRLKDELPFSEEKDLSGGVESRHAESPSVEDSKGTAKLKKQEPREPSFITGRSRRWEGNDLGSGSSAPPAQTSLKRSRAEYMRGYRKKRKVCPHCHQTI